MTNIADIRGGKPNLASEQEEKKELNLENQDGEDITPPEDPDKAPKPLHPDEIAFQKAEEERLAKEEADRKAKELAENGEVPPVTPSPTIDYKEKFSNSSREAQILAQKLKETEALLGKLTSENIPSDEEIARTVPGYEYMSDGEKYLVKRQMAVENESRRTTLTTERKRLQDEYKQQIDTMVVSDPRLKGKEDAFREFISKPSRAGVDGETLLSAFLFDANASAPSTTTPPTRPGLARGVGGSQINSPEQNKSGYTEEQIAFMRKNEPKKYMDLVRRKLI